eukprot:1141949-Pelagomonas_calceolata.AAC.5
MEKLPSDQQQIPKNITQNQQTLSPLIASSPNRTGKSGHTQMDAAILQGHTHIATNSFFFPLHQERKRKTAVGRGNFP